jgi:hypothetical protein
MNSLNVLFSFTIIAKLYNYLDVVDTAVEQKKELMEMSNEDLEFLVSKLNSGRNSFIENAESKLIQTPKSQYSVLTEQKNERKKEEVKNSRIESNHGDNLQSTISRLDDKISGTAEVQTDLSMEDINKWQK